MKLSYRGVSYEYNPPMVETTAGAVGGKYRGRDWRFRNLKKPPVLQPTANLTYRGVTYSKPSTTIDNTGTSEKAADSTQEKARTLMLNHTQASKKRQQALLSRSAQEIGLVAKVSDYWNRIQGKTDPSF